MNLSSLHNKIPLILPLTHPPAQSSKPGDI